MIAGNREKEKEAQIRAEVHSSVADFSPKQMVSTGSFWVIYLIMTMVAFGGLVVTAQLKPMAKSYHADQMVIFGGMTALVLAIGIVYTSKGLASLFAGPGAAWLFTKTGSWQRVFWAMIACDVTAALLAIFWLKPVANRTVAEAQAMTVAAVEERKPQVPAA